MVTRQGPPRAPRRLNKSEMDHAARMAKIANWSKLVDGLRTAFVVASYAVPMLAVRAVAQEVAGTETNFTFSFQVSLVFSGALGIGNYTQWRLIRRQKKDLVELRSRLSRYEQDDLRASTDE